MRPAADRPGSAAGSRRRSGAWFGLVTDARAIGKGQFQHDAPDIRSERPMHLTGGTAGIMAEFQPQVKRLVVQPSADDEYFLGIRVALAAETGRVGTGMKPGEASVLARDRIDAEGELFGHPLEPSDWGPTPRALGGQRIPVSRQRLRHLAPRNKRPCDPPR